MKYACMDVHARFVFTRTPTARPPQIDPNIVIKSVSIYNMLGQLMQVNDNIAETIDVSGLKAGNYFVKLVRDNGSTVEKFVKE